MSLDVIFWGDQIYFSNTDLQGEKIYWEDQTWMFPIHVILHETKTQAEKIFVPLILHETRIPTKKIES